MTSKLVPSDPASVMSIRQVTPSITTLSLPFSRFGRIHIGGRATLVKLPSGAVAVFSPVALTPAVKSTVAEIGPVKYIAATDIEHHIFIGDWHKEYPDAKVIAPEGLPEKRAQLKYTDDRYDSIFKAGEHRGRDGTGLKVDDEFDAEFDAEFVHSHTNKELVFNFRRERTMIEADLIFNLPATEQYSKANVGARDGILTRFFMAFQGTTGNAALWQQRFIWYAASSGDREAFKQSIRRIDAWDFDRIVPCHGDVIESGGKGVFQHIMEWFLK